MQDPARRTPHFDRLRALVACLSLVAAATYGIASTDDALAGIGDRGNAHGHVSDGRIPGQPDFERVGAETRRFDPATHSYRVQPKPGAQWMRTHVDPPEPIVALAGTGPGTELPVYEDAPHCAKSGHRIRLVWSHASGQGSASDAIPQIRSLINRMNWKVRQQSEQSSGNARSVQMVVECDSAGAVTVHQVESASQNAFDIRNAVEGRLGRPSGAHAVKYLIFRTGCGYSSAGFKYNDATKSTANANRRLTTSAIAYGGISTCYLNSWSTHVPLHELAHTMGATQYPTGDPAPYATPGGHCNDGLDVLCYDDGTLPGYSETRCPAGGWYETSVGVSLDCGYDTYFDALEENGEWLNSHWNVGGEENPFLAVNPPYDDPADDMLDVGAIAVGSEVDIVARGTNNAVRHSTLVSDFAQPWTTLGGSITSAPSMVNRGGSLIDLFALGASGDILHRWHLTPYGWSNWGSQGGTFASAPAAVSRSSGLIDLYARASNGALWHKWFTDSHGWSGWASMGGNITSAPTVVSRGPGVIDMFARGPNTDVLHQWYSDSTGWSGWASLGGQVASNPVAVSSHSTNMTVFARGIDDVMYMKTWRSSGGWGTWIPLGGRWISSPAAASPRRSYGADYDVFAIGTDNLVWRTRTNGTTTREWVPLHP